MESPGSQRTARQEGTTESLNLLGCKQRGCRAGAGHCVSLKRAPELVTAHCMGQVISYGFLPKEELAPSLPSMVCVPQAFLTYIETFLTTTKTPQGPWPWSLSSHRPSLHW